MEDRTSRLRRLYNETRQLLRCGTRLDVNAPTYLGESALSLAARKGHLSVVEGLLEDRRTDP